jgi:hypothetical protein
MAVRLFLLHTYRTVLLTFVIVPTASCSYVKPESFHFHLYNTVRQCCVLPTSAWNASKGIPQSHGPTQHKNSGRTVLYKRYERFGEIWRMVSFFEAARLYPTTTKTSTNFSSRLHVIRKWTSQLASQLLWKKEKWSFWYFGANVGLLSELKKQRQRWMWS